MLIYIAIACIGAKDTMIVEDEYYELKSVKVIENKEGAKYTLFAIGGFCSFFVCFGLRHCRSPPFINLFLKKFKLIGGKKDGRTPKKKKI